MHKLMLNEDTLPRLKSFSNWGRRSCLFFSPLCFQQQKALPAIFNIKSSLVNSKPHKNHLSPTLKVHQRNWSLSGPSHTMGSIDLHIPRPKWPPKFSLQCRQMNNKRLTCHAPHCCLCISQLSWEGEATR